MYNDIAARKNEMHESRFGDGNYPKNVTFKRLFLQLILQDIMHVPTQLLTKWNYSFIKYLAANPLKL
jgi:hypothetical protein